MSVAYGGWLDRKYRRALEAIPQNLVATVLSIAVAAPAFSTVSDLPTRRAQPAPVQRTLTQNLVVNVLAGQDAIYGDPGQAPTVVFPNPPRGPRRATQYEQGPNLQAVLAIPPEDVPPGVVRFELPPRGPTRLRADLTRNLVPTTLSGQDQLYGDPGQVPTVVFPNPVPLARRVPVALQGPNLQALLNVPPEDLPPGVVRTELPPRGPTRLRPDGTQNLSLTTLPGQGTLYGAPGQAPTIVWSNPRPRPTGPIANRTWLPSGSTVASDASDRRAIVTWLEFEVPDAMPETSGLQPLPVRPAPRLLRPAAQNPSPALLVSQSLPPGEQAIVLPTGPRRVAQPEQPRNLQPLLTTSLPPGVVMFTLPPEPARRLSAGFIVALPRALVGQDSIYGAPGQAPTIVFPLPPRGYPPGPRANRTLLVRTVGLIGQDRIYAGPGQVPTRIPPNARGYPPGPVANRTQTINLTHLIGLSIIAPTEPAQPFVPGTIDPTRSSAQADATDPVRTSTAPGNPAARSSTTGGSL